MVKWFDPGRGTGVIVQDGGGPDALACPSAVHGDAGRILVAGERVVFDVTLDAGGVRADNIHAAGASGPPRETAERESLELQAGDCPGHADSVRAPQASCDSSASCSSTEGEAPSRAECFGGISPSM
ncbi:cold shock domain-containing protein [Streptomyces phaeochromogenes]|nr:cold shock domain-containing protein [Streptomyces phaeochromogenes]